MDIPVKKLVRLLKPEQPEEVRAAAALVAGELGVKDKDVAAELLDRLADESEAVRLNAIRAAGQLGVSKALAPLLDRIAHGGPEAGAAAEAAARLGTGGVKGLQELMHRVVPGVRKYIAAALTSTGEKGSDAAGVAVLLDRDPQVAAAAADAIISRIPALAPDRKAALAAELIAVATAKKAPLPASAELPVVRVLARLNDPRAAGALWDRVLPPTPTEVRATALQTVGGWVKVPTKEQWHRLFQCATDADFRVAAPALMILSRLDVADKQIDDWLALLNAPDVAARRLAVEKVGDRDTDAVAGGLMAQLAHPDRGVRDAARSRLVKLKAGRKALVATLLDTESTDEAWQLARSVAPFAADLTPAVRTNVLDHACGHLDSGDHRADPLLYLLREADPGKLRDELFERAVALRKKKKYDAALVYLKTLARDPSIGFPVRLELAFCGLKASAKELAEDARVGDPALHQFGHLVQQDADLLRKEVEKAKWLDPDDLFYVGFHFSEQVGRPQAFGAAVLQLVVKRSPKGKTAQAAKNKLKSSGAV